MSDYGIGLTGVTERGMRGELETCSLPRIACCGTGHPETEGSGRRKCRKTGNSEIRNGNWAALP